MTKRPTVAASMAARSSSMPRPGPSARAPRRRRRRRGGGAELPRLDREGLLVEAPSPRPSIRCRSIGLGHRRAVAAQLEVEAERRAPGPPARGRGRRRLPWSGCGRADQGRRRQQGATSRTSSIRPAGGNDRGVEGAASVGSSRRRPGRAGAPRTTGAQSVQTQAVQTQASDPADQDRAATVVDGLGVDDQAQVREGAADLASPETGRRADRRTRAASRPGSRRR